MNIKKVLIISILPFLFVGNITAQQESEPQYLFDMKSVKISGFGGIISDFSFVRGDIATSSGGGGAVLFNYNSYFGFYGLNLSTNILQENMYNQYHDPISNPLYPMYKNLQLLFENSGVWIGYINNHNKLVHWGASLKAGQGILALYDKDLKYDRTEFLFKDKVFVASPEIEVEMNITRWCKLNVGVGYRFVTGIEDIVYTNVGGNKVSLYKNSDFNSPYANVKLLFGWFAKRNRGVQESSK